MTDAGHDLFRSGDPLFAFDEELHVVAWNRAAERLTGIPAEDALGRRCWEVLGGVDDDGAVICHRGCAAARLVREGWPVPSREVNVRTRRGRRKVSLATVAVRNGGAPVFLHLLHEPLRRPPSPRGAPRLSRRQRQVLGLLAEGVPAKVAAARLGLAEATVRNHIRALLVALGAHSQLEALAIARRRGLLED
ncbi:MAG TPA: LuxR C-terminal-related transcriptional regulator [Gaiellaceae bacterium]|nr:LuxR C-terminal-related transcriptional regulator [Gaiellaceae bacterium]